MKFNLLAALLWATLLSCQDLVVQEHIVGRYYLIATDSEEEQTLGYALGNGSFIGLVPGYVFAVAYNKKYIVVKQRPSYDDKGIVNYYTIECQYVDASHMKAVNSPPSTETVFNSNKAHLEAFGRLKFQDFSN
ncbi:hypothetical protein M0L20_28610 [Spirosoma sp. RP8]|uniref:Uncharacterized protein n=1 Tax=Spirosoma liriopis TaxID=2937440 RepID=A0ABT0HVH6_9BACT|nr:hypothetical protein [Spirosoma liriopis]MCK8495862.1 hypothetical protein [Spirosoma liriopis]